MSEKGLYKKIIGHGWDHPEGAQRSRENRFFDKVQSEEVSKKVNQKQEARQDQIINMFMNQF